MVNIILSGSNPFDKKKVTGIGAVISVLRENPAVNYKLIPLGRSSDQKHDFSWMQAQIKLLTKIIKTAVDKKFKIAHVNTCTNPSAILRDAFIVMVFSLFKKNIILHMHGGKYLFEPPKSKVIKSIFNFSCSKSKLILVLSDYEKDNSILKTKYSSKLRVLKNCINSSNVPKIAFEQKNLHDIVFIGRIVESKGIDDLVKALEILAKQRSDFRFIMCGSGDLTELTIKQLKNIRELNFEFKGIVLGEEKWNVLKESGIFILPSRHGEGLPIALIEAMATKTVCVVTDDASMKQVVTDDTNGILIKKYAPEDIVRKLNDLLDNDQKITQIGYNAFRYYEENFNMENYFKLINKYYEEVSDK